MENSHASPLARMDQQFSWHPFTQMRAWIDPENEPLILVEGNGAILKDSQGREYLDGNSSIWTNLHGHRHPKINAAIVSQLQKIAHVSYLGAGNEPATRLAARLSGLFPSGTLPRVFFSDNGSTAIEVALKMTAQFWQQTGNPERNLFVTFDQAYHGDTAGAASLGGVPLFHERFSAFHFPVLRVKTIEELQSLPEMQQGRIAAVVIEPLVQGVNRIRLWPQGMLAQLRNLCNQNDMLLILDEVMTGFGRTGSLFACQKENVIPDFLCLAKGLSGGYLPLAATLTTGRIFEAFLGEFEEQKTFYYGHSYTANPLACAAALANLDIFEEENTLKKIQHLSDQLSRLLNELLGDSANVTAVRQIGLIAGIDVTNPDGSAFPAKKQMGFRVCESARKHGLLTRNIGDTVVLMPPYCSTKEQLSRMIQAVQKGVAETCG